MPDVEYRCANRAGPVANRRPAASRPRGRCRDQTRPQPWGAKLAPNGVRPHVTGGGTLSFDYHPGGFGGAVFEVRTDTGQDGVTVVTVAGEVDMTVSPQFEQTLLDAAGAGGAPPVVVDLAGDVITLSLSGPLTLHRVPEVRGLLLRCLTECPAALVVDLSDLVVDSDLPLAVFPAVARRVRAWPGAAPILLCVPPGPVADRLARWRRRRYLTVHGSR